MKKTLCIALLLLSALGAGAQEHLLLRVGAGITSLYDADAKNIGAFSVGLGYEYEFDQHWSVSPMLLYHTKGWKEKDALVPAKDDAGNEVYDENGDQVYGHTGVKSHAYYLQLPILVNYYIHLQSPHYISLSAGPYFAYGVGGKTETYGDYDREGAERLYYEEDTFGDDVGAHRFDMGLTLAVGYEYNRHINLAVNADLGLTKVRPSGGRNRTLYLSFLYRL